uniref:ribosomal protein S16 n=1 Tax=Madagascaria erythrocladioides TaxID=753684 RepID=UPI001BEFEB44|nr:ribosomal protein S16 [Madagascaria erythrocladioides]QUE29093.1 ribosomal protein S16 [Madagascaria erythrocladioides]UNJ16649.1 ribosomal protein S16 [Madagascaria erythrocladioides]
MIKIRLKRFGRKRQASYRIVIMNSKTRRDGRPIREVGFYDPISKETRLNTEEIKKWLDCGVQPTTTVKNMLIKANLIK